MARVPIPVPQLETMALDFAKVVETLNECLKQVRELGMTDVLIHVKSVQNKHLPEIKDWVTTVAHDIELQCNAFKEHRPSKAEKSVARAATQKKSAVMATKAGQRKKKQ